MLGYLSYRSGTAQLLAQLDAVALPRALTRIHRASTPGFGLLTLLYVHGDEDSPLTRLLSTHPPLEERVERLREQRAAQCEDRSL